MAVAKSAGLAVLFGLLAGCISGPSPSEAPVKDPPTLGAFATCRLTYPDGGPVPCATEAERIVPSDSPPTPGWICQSKAGGPGYHFATYWNPVDGTYAVGYEYPPFHGPTPGVGRVRTAGGQRLVEWSHPSSQAFVELPAWVKSGHEVDVELYQFSHASNVTQLKDADVLGLPSQYGESVWWVYEVRARAQSYYFQSMNAFTFMGQTFYVSEDLNLTGADFDLQIRRTHTGGHGFRLGAGLLETDC